MSDMEIMEMVFQLQDKNRKLKEDLKDETTWKLQFRKERDDLLIEVEKLRGFKLGVYKLLVDGVGPGGGYYTRDQRLGAAEALLKIGWAS